MKRQHDAIESDDEELQQGSMFPIQRLSNDVLSVVLRLVDAPISPLEGLLWCDEDEIGDASKLSVRLVCRRWNQVYCKFAKALFAFPAAPKFEPLAFRNLFPNLRHLTLGDTRLGSQYDAPDVGQSETLLQLLPKLESISFNFVVDFSAGWTRHQTGLSSLSLLYEPSNSRVTFMEQGQALAEWIERCPRLTCFEIGTEVHSVDHSGVLALALGHKRRMTKLHLLGSDYAQRSAGCFSDSELAAIVRHNSEVQDLAVVAFPSQATLRLCTRLQRLFIKSQLSWGALPAIATLRELHVASLSWGDFRRIATYTALERIGLFDLVHDELDTTSTFDDVIHFLNSCRQLRQWNMPQVSSFLGQRFGAPREEQQEEQERNARHFLDACKGRHIAFTANIVELLSLFDARRRGGAVRELHELINPAFFSCQEASEDGSAPEDGSTLSGNTSDSN